MSAINLTIDETKWLTDKIDERLKNAYGVLEPSYQAHYMAHFTAEQIASAVSDRKREIAWLEAMRGKLTGEGK
jgi:hypothetical protein